MSDWIWVLIIIVAILIIVGVGIAIFRNTIRDPDKTKSAVGGKCSSTVPCPTGLTCSKFFCQNSGITTGEVGAFCTTDGEFPTTSGSSSPGCNTAAGFNCLASVCVRGTAGSTFDSFANQPQNLLVTMVNSENPVIFPSDRLTMISEPFQSSDQGPGMDFGMNFGGEVKPISSLAQKNRNSMIHFGSSFSKSQSDKYSGRYDTVTASERCDSDRYPEGHSEGHSEEYNVNRHSGRYDSNRHSGRYDSNRHSERYDSNRHSERYDSNRHSGRYDSNRHSGRYDSNRYDSNKCGSDSDSSRMDGRASLLGRHSNGYLSHETTHQSGRHFSSRKRSKLWKVNQKGDVDHYNLANQEWENIFPSGFGCLVRGKTTQLTAQAISALESDSGRDKVVVSFKSANREFSHSLFYEIVVNQGKGRPFVLIPWTIYRDEGFDGKIFCPVSETSYSKDSDWLETSPKTLGLEWAPIVCSKVELQENGDLWIEGHMVGSNRSRLFVPSSRDHSKEYLARDGKLN